METQPGSNQPAAALAARPGARSLGGVFWWLWAGNLLSALAPPRAQGRTMGAYGFCFSLGCIAAPAIGSAVLEAFGPRVLWPATAVLGVAAAAGLLGWEDGRVASPEQAGAAEGSRS